MRAQYPLLMALAQNPPLTPFSPSTSNPREKIFFDAFGMMFLRVPQGHVQGVSEPLTLNSMSL